MKKDYLDGDVAYLLGLLVARGTLIDSADAKKLVIHFPFSSLKLEGLTQQFDQEKEIRLGLESIKNRLHVLLDCQFEQTVMQDGVDLVARFFHNNMMWRNLHLILEDATSFTNMHVPEILFDPETPTDWKREFVLGFADVAGNIRHANRFTDGRNRVRLDVLNYRTNWKVPVQLCTLLQFHLGVPVQLITWGHPNMNRKFREHQLNVFAHSFTAIGFTFNHKQSILEEFALQDVKALPSARYMCCPGERKYRGRKPRDKEERNADRLDSELVGKHFNSYWQVCRALGCPRRPSDMDIEQLDMEEVFDLGSADE